MADENPVQQWWSERPMTYGADHGTTHYRLGDGREVDITFGSTEFFQIVDQKVNAWNEPLHDATGPFGRIFPYARFAGKQVLEVGCGMGAMASYWAQRGAVITACDLSPISIEQTSRRFQLSNLTGKILLEDGRRLSFPTATFDYAYSWGVLHHSPNLASSLRELLRVVKPGGEFGIMLYYRKGFLYRYRIRYIEAFLHGESEFLDPLKLASRYTDDEEGEGNPHTWPVTKPEVREMIGAYSEKLAMQVLGTDVDYQLSRALPVPGLVRWLPKAVVKAWARRWGWSLWITGTRNTTQIAPA
jgi:ubiquinone/menaquinone biosynthesis C-methylase UbiE